MQTPGRTALAIWSTAALLVLVTLTGAWALVSRARAKAMQDAAARAQRFAGSAEAAVNRTHVDCGSTFRVTLPMALASAAQAEPPDSRHGGMDEARDRRLRVLVAEDDEVNQIIMQSVLAPLGHDCVVCADGREAPAATP